MGKVTPSKEDYLESIYNLSGGTEGVRSIDVAAELGFSRASVSRAMGILKQDGYINQEPYGQVTLTDKGRELACAVRKRHDLLKYFLLHIVEVDEETAEADACKMEHVVSEQTLGQIAKLSALHMLEFHMEKKEK